MRDLAVPRFYRSTQRLLQPVTTRHRDERGRYLPNSAEHQGQLQRRRPRQDKLAADGRLRSLVQPS